MSSSYGPMSSYSGSAGSATALADTLPSSWIVASASEAVTTGFESDTGLLSTLSGFSSPSSSSAPYALIPISFLQSVTPLRHFSLSPPGAVGHSSSLPLGHFWGQFVMASQ